MSKDGQPKKIRVGILFGGKSAEHDVSVQSARNIQEVLDSLEQYEVLPIYINQHGEWQAPGIGSWIATKVDVVIPVLHGPYGEDGTVQGFLDLIDVPYVGSGVLGSAVGMDKDIMKRLLREAGIPVAQGITIRREDELDIDDIVTWLGLPLFVKPANMGSSVGVSKVSRKQDLKQAIADAFRYDRKILVEAAVVGDEVECAVLGNAQPQASAPGRVVTKAEFYDYHEKYQDSELTSLEVPAKMTDALAEKVRHTALQAFGVLECEGLARVDMFVTAEGKVIVNEVNTMPGFTRLSMYPKVWEASGVSYADLIIRLIDLAFERQELRRVLSLATPDA